MSDASLLVVRRTFVEISEPEDENRHGGSWPPISAAIKLVRAWRRKRS